MKYFKLFLFCLLLSVCAILCFACLADLIVPIALFAANKDASYLWLFGLEPVLIFFFILSVCGIALVVERWF